MASGLCTRRWSHVYAHIIRFRTHLPRLEIETKHGLITFYRSFQMCTRPSSAVHVLHPQSASFIWTEAGGIIPTRIIISIEINHKITEHVCKIPHLYYLSILQYNGVKITTNVWVSDVLDLFVIMFH